MHDVLMSAYYFSAKLQQTHTAYAMTVPVLPYRILCRTPQAAVQAARAQLPAQLPANRHGAQGVGRHDPAGGLSVRQRKGSSSGFSGYPRFAVDALALAGLQSYTIGFHRAGAAPSAAPHPRSSSHASCCRPAGPLPPQRARRPHRPSSSRPRGLSLLLRARPSRHPAAPRPRHEAGAAKPGRFASGARSGLALRPACSWHSGLRPKPAGPRRDDRDAAPLARQHDRIHTDWAPPPAAAASRHGHWCSGRWPSSADAWRSSCRRSRPAAHHHSGSGSGSGSGGQRDGARPQRSCGVPGASRSCAGWVVRRRLRRRQRSGAWPPAPPCFGSTCCCRSRRSGCSCGRGALSRHVPRAWL